MKFCFGDIVVVESNLIGVVVKSWCPSLSSKKEPYHEVYVRYFSEIREYRESEMERYMVRHKYLSDEEIIYQDNAVNNHQTEYDEIYKTFFDRMAEKIKNDIKIEMNRGNSSEQKEG